VRGKWCYRLQLDDMNTIHSKHPTINACDKLSHSSDTALNSRLREDIVVLYPI
jgi:hypothetical protein